MKKVFAGIPGSSFYILLTLLITFIFPGLSMAQDQESKWKVGPTGISACIGYDFENETDKEGIFITLFSRRDWNVLDLGAFGEIDLDAKKLENLDLWLGSSYSVLKKEITEKTSLTLGFFINPGLLDNHPFGYGIYFAGKYELGK